MKKTAVFTIASKNYFAQVMVLMMSLKEKQPQWDRYVMLVDEVDEHTLPLIEKKDIFTIISARSLPLPSPDKMFFRYNILELNTAVKPWAFEKLFSDGYDAVVYMDPDIIVYRDMHEIDECLKIDGAIILTPHITQPLTDEKKPNELNILQGGTYNLGFIAVSNGKGISEYVSWWERKLEYDCVVDLPRGLFVDQKWMDLVPALFDNVKIFKHQGYNTAYWNLSERKFKKENGIYYCNDDPLVFFHFSGFNPNNYSNFSKHQDRFTIKTVDAEVKELAEDYAKKVISYGYNTICKLPYQYNYFHNGVQIVDAFRRIYNASDEIKLKCGEDPFAYPDIYNEFLQLDEHIIMNPIMEDIWQHRSDLQEVFKNYRGSQNLAYAKWYVDSVEREYNMDPVFVEPVRCRISEVLSFFPNTKNDQRTASEEEKMAEMSTETNLTQSKKRSMWKVIKIRFLFFIMPIVKPLIPIKYKESIKKKYLSIVESKD